MMQLQLEFKKGKQLQKRRGLKENCCTLWIPEDVGFWALLVDKLVILWSIILVYDIIVTLI